MNLKKAEWAGGFADHNFDWVDGAGYHWQKYEPIHHEESICIISLVKVFEATKERKYLGSCKKWVDYQVP